MIKKTGIFLALLLSFKCYPQIKELEYNYTPLVSAGILPEIFTKTATEKTNQDLEELKKDKTQTDKNLKEKFYVKSNFHVDYMLRGGRILFNDSLTTFVNKVADITFKNNPEIRKEIQIFVLKSDIVNAFTTYNGVILISVGLLAQLDNEAQLSFILCHEAAHYLKKHSLDSYIDFNSKKTNYSTNDILDKFKYSQDNELEADVEGVKIFRTTNYSYKGLTGAFNVLKYSHFPFDEKGFEKSFLEDSNLVFPKNYFLEKISTKENSEDYDDSRSSHPNIKKRKEAVGKELGEFSEDGRKKFIINEQQFLKIREYARFELCRIELLNREYADCIYDCYLLQEKYPHNEYLKVTIGKALYQVAAAKSIQATDYKSTLEPSIDLTGGSTSVKYNYDDIEGSSQQVYHLFSKMGAVQSSVLALHYNWKLRKELGEKNKIVNRLCDSLFILLALNGTTDLSYFSKLSRKEFLSQAVNSQSLSSASAKDTIKDAGSKKMTTLDELEMNESEESRTTRIVALSVQPNIAANGANSDSLFKVANDSIRRYKLDCEFDKFVFCDMLKDSAFTKKYRGAENVASAYKKRYDNYSKKKPEPKNVGGIEIDKIVMLDPFYFKFDERNRDEAKYFDADEKLHKYAGILQDNAKLARLDFEYIDSHTMKPGDIEKYNDFAMLNDWMDEYLSHGYNQNMMVLNNEACERIQTKYNTRFVLWSGVVNARFKKQNVGSLIFLSLFVYTMPFTLPLLLKKEERTMYMSVLFDLKYNKIVYYHTTVLRLSDTNDFLNAFVYETMLTIKAPPKMK